MLGVGVGVGDLAVRGGASAPSGYDLTAYFAAVGAGVEQQQKPAIQEMMDALLAAGITAKLRDLHIPLATAEGSKPNIVAPSEMLIIIGSPGFGAYYGWYGDIASSAALELALADNNAAPWSQNAGSLFAYVVEEPIVNGALLGLSNISSTRIVAVAGGAPTGRIHNATAVAATTGNSLGLICVVRVDATTIKIYRNGVLEGTQITSATGATTSATFRVFQNNTQFGDSVVACFGVAGPLDAAENLSLYNAIQGLGGAIGFGV